MPWSNHRDDEYGGDFTGRLRFLAELVAAIRESCGNGFLLGLKLPGDDGVPQSIGPALAADRPARSVPGRRGGLLSSPGAAMRERSTYLPDMHWPRAPFADVTAQLRRAIPDTPVMAVGLITDPAEAEGLLAQDKADLVALGRPLVTDAAWLAKAADGRAGDIRYCVSCNSCWGTIVEQSVRLRATHKLRVVRRTRRTGSRRAPPGVCA